MTCKRRELLLCCLGGHATAACRARADGRAICRQPRRAGGGDSPRWAVGPLRGRRRRWPSLRAAPPGQRPRQRGNLRRDSPAGRPVGHLLLSREWQGAQGPLCLPPFANRALCEPPHRQSPPPAARGVPPACMPLPSSSRHGGSRAGDGGKWVAVRGRRAGRVAPARVAIRHTERRPRRLSGAAAGRQRNKAEPRQTLWRGDGRQRFVRRQWGGRCGIRDLDKVTSEMSHIFPIPFWGCPVGWPMIGSQTNRRTMLTAFVGTEAQDGPQFIPIPESHFESLPWTSEGLVTDRPKSHSHPSHPRGRPFSLAGRPRGGNPSAR